MIRRSAFLVNDTSVSGHPGCVTVMAVIRDQLEMRGLSVAGRWPMGAEPQLGLAMAPALRQADVVIVNGEGTLHNTAQRPGARRLLHAIKRVHATTPAPIFLINATIERLRPRDFEVLRLCHRIHLRDEASCRYAAAHGLAARLTPDLCFAADYGAAPRGARRIVTDSTLAHTAALLRRCSKAVGAQYLPMQPARLHSMMHWAITPHRHERQAARYFARIASAAALVTGRFHAAVFALMAGTPFLALDSNTSKMRSLLLDVLGTEERVIEPAALERSSPPVPAFSVEELARIRTYRADAAIRSQAMFDHIAQAAALSGAQAA